jgi:hypothetical protein
MAMRVVAGETRMKLNLLILTVVGWITAVPLAVSAHHSHPYTYDWCKTVTVEGRVESVDWKDPHTLVFVRPDDGGAIYIVDWVSLGGLTNKRLIAQAQAALVPGARIAVTAAPIRSLAEIRAKFPDYNYEVNPRTLDPRTIGVGDSFNWSLPPGTNAVDCTGKQGPTVR